MELITIALTSSLITLAHQPERGEDRPIARRVVVEQHDDKGLSLQRLLSGLGGTIEVGVEVHSDKGDVDIQGLSLRDMLEHAKGGEAQMKAVIIGPDGKRREMAKVLDMSELVENIDVEAILNDNYVQEFMDETVAVDLMAAFVDDTDGHGHQWDVYRSLRHDHEARGADQGRNDRARIARDRARQRAAAEEAMRDRMHRAQRQAEERMHRAHQALRDRYADRHGHHGHEGHESHHMHDGDHHGEWVYEMHADGHGMSPAVRAHIIEMMEAHGEGHGHERDHHGHHRHGDGHGHDRDAHGHHRHGEGHGHERDHHGHHGHGDGHGHDREHHGHHHDEHDGQEWIFDWQFEDDDVPAEVMEHVKARLKESWGSDAHPHRAHAQMLWHGEDSHADGMWMTHDEDLYVLQPDGGHGLEAAHKKIEELHHVINELEHHIAELTEHHHGADHEGAHRFMEAAESFIEQLQYAEAVGAQLGKDLGVALLGIWFASEHMDPDPCLNLMVSIMNDQEVARSVRRAAAFVAMEKAGEMGNHEGAERILEAIIRGAGHTASGQQHRTDQASDRVTDRATDRTPGRATNRAPDRAPVRAR